ncbi:hypothetical protein UY3_05226 [Chelonia mydas]|uniref:Uncharacterized protein n=1 Tax=Chelonia mydas TaxID=8469 RepID=M7BI49_CHEMY|nr:hypothetical protein UY3_05225 [Chelonia mydas]EMP37596.1 hypothetical protein UY3_05226 [Chelonia mydas]
MDRKVYSSASLLFRISNCLLLMAKYDFLNYVQMVNFVDKLPQQDRAYFQAILEEGKLVTRTIFHAAVDSTDTSSYRMATQIIMSREFWLDSSGFPREVQSTTEDFPFDESYLFNQKTDDSLHSLKDSRAALQSLGIYMPVPK